MTKAMSGKTTQNTLIFKTTASTPNNGLLLQHLLDFSQSSYCKGMWVNVNGQCQGK